MSTREEEKTEWGVHPYWVFLGLPESVPQFTPLPTGPRPVCTTALVTGPHTSEELLGLQNWLSPKGTGRGELSIPGVVLLGLGWVPEGLATFLLYLVADSFKGQSGTYRVLGECCGGGKRSKGVALYSRQHKGTCEK